jgi:hypothetical protein
MAQRGLWESAVVVVGLIAVALSYGSEDAKKAAFIGPPAPRVTVCKDDWRKCADNSDLINQYGEISTVKNDCRRHADDLAKYGKPEWPWIAFGRYWGGTDYVAKGIARLQEDDAEFQNGFGAMVRSRVTCTYDLAKQQVINVTIKQR